MALLEELLARHQVHDPQAFAELYGHLHPRLVRFFRAWTASRAEADDLAQATLIRIHDVRHTYERGRPAGWRCGSRNRPRGPERRPATTGRISAARC
jgi:DNA-directed RNA polymerase specialized sigma24 family protein